MWIQQPRNLSFQSGHGKETLTINDCPRTIGINWNCPRQTGTYNGIRCGEYRDNF